MNRLLDRRNAIRTGLFAATGLGFLARHAEASTETESQNKAVVGRWFTEFWGKTYNPAIVDALASPDMLLKYSLHEPRHGRENIKVFMAGFRAAFPDLNFWGTAPLIAEGMWEGLILDAPRGSGGFGYDPYFWLPDLGVTVAQLDLDEKNRLSHRGMAMRALRDLLRARERCEQRPADGGPSLGQGEGGG